MQHRRPTSISWRAPQFLFKRKSLIWYTHICLFFFIVLAGLFIIENWLGIVVAVALFWAFLAKSGEHPKIVDYKVSHQGVCIDGHTLPYSAIRAFSVDTSQTKPVIILEMAQPMSMPLTLVIKKMILEDAIAILNQHIPTQEHPSLIHRLNHWLHY